MTYRTKYFAALTLLVIGCILVVLGYLELSGSFGVTEIIRSGVWKLGIGVVLVMIFSPLFHYYRARKQQSFRSEDAEVLTLARLGEQRLKEQEKQENEGGRHE